MQGQPGAPVSLGGLGFEQDSGGYYGGFYARRLVQTWSQVSVPANGRVILMHFVVQEVNRAGSRAAAERLVQLPPEAIDALTADERQGVRNFNVPADGQGTVGALPALTGRVEGHAFEGDHATPARSAQVQVKSLSALFGRRWQTYTGTQGEFEIAGVVVADYSRPIPVDIAVSVVATHRLTALASPTYTASFTDGANAVTQDLTLPSGRITGRVVSPPDYAIGSNGYVTAFMGGTRVGQANGLASDSTFAIGGLGAGTYRLDLQVFHPQGSSLSGRRPASA